jgi:hypothetical protein
MRADPRAGEAIAGCGRFQEWFVDLDDPGTVIDTLRTSWFVPGLSTSPRRTPELAHAARCTLELRGERASQAGPSYGGPTCRLRASALQRRPSAMSVTWRCDRACTGECSCCCARRRTRSSERRTVGCRSHASREVLREDVRGVWAKLHTVEASSLPCVSRKDDVRVRPPEAGQVRTVCRVSHRRQRGQWELEGWSDDPQGGLRDGARARPPARQAVAVRVRTHPGGRTHPRPSPRARGVGASPQRGPGRQPARKPRVVDQSAAVRHPRERRHRLGGRDPRAVRGRRVVAHLQQCSRGREHSWRWRESNRQDPTRVLAGQSPSCPVRPQFWLSASDRH